MKKLHKKLLAALLSAALLLSALPFTASAAGENLWESAMKLDNLALTATAEGDNYLGSLGSLLFGADRVNDGDLATVWRAGSKGTADDNAVLTFHWDEMQEIACVSVIWVAYYPDLPNAMLGEAGHDGYEIQVTNDNGEWIGVGIINATRTGLGDYISELTPEQTAGVDMSMFTDVCLDIDLFGVQKTKDLRIICKDPAQDTTEEEPAAKEYPMANEVYFFDNDIWTLALNYQLGREEFPVDENGKLIGYNSVGRDVVLPETVRSIGAYFTDAKIETITLPATLTGNFTANFFTSCANLKEIIVAEGNPAYTVEDGVLYNADKTRLILYPAAKEGESFTVPASVREIGEYAFAGAQNLTSVTLPDGLELIGDNAFWGAMITEIELPDTLTTLGAGAFALSALETITVPGSVGYLRAETFTFCFDLKEVVFGEGITELGDSTFGGCMALESVTLPKSLETVCNDAFAGCFGLEEYNYAGTDAEWNAIDFGLGNSSLLALKGGVIGTVDYTTLAAVTSDSIVDNRSDLADFLANDGDKTTRWQSGASCKDGDDGWLAYEWEEAYKFTDLTIEWEVSRASLSGYVIESSDDGETWTNVPMTNSRKDLADSHYLDTVTFTEPVTTDHLRVRIISMENSLKDHPSIYEMTCFGEGIVVEEPQDIDAGASEGLAYELVGDSYTVTGIGTCTDTEIIVPSRYNGKRVDEVASGAFKDLTDVTLIKFSEGIAYVDAKAIDNCSALETVSLPSTIYYIECEAIASCPDSLEILYDSGLSTLDEMLFSEEETPASVFTEEYDIQPYSRVVTEKPAPAEVLKGDTDGDGSVTSSDLTVLAKHVGGVLAITDGELLANADIDGDGSVGAADLTKLARFVGGIDDTL